MSQSMVAPQAPRRVHALDALRGIAILMMILSGVVPGTYPAWMHHAQVPPPNEVFNPNIAGITWVDLVFPFFLFCLGAAIPLSLGRRMEKGDPWWKLTWGVIQRFLLLGLFAVYVAQIRPFSFDPPYTTTSWARALAAFAALFAILVRMPATWPKPVKPGIRFLGWAVAAGLMYTLHRGNGKGFDPQDSDIIIMILANVVWGVSLVWALSRNNTVMRLGYMAFLMAIRLAGDVPGWVNRVWTASPEHWLYVHHLFPVDGPWLFHQGYTGLMFIAIPGTIIGDLLVKWMKAPVDEGTGWSVGRWSAIATLSFALFPILIWGLFTRHVVEVAIIAVIVGATIRYLAAKPALAAERLIHDVAAWGAFWLALGLVFEPYEHGIHKDPATMSYYFVSAGLACFVLISFTIVMDVFKKVWMLRLLSDNGQNPMMAYVGLTNLVQPLIFIVGLKPWIDKQCLNNDNMSFFLSAVEVVLVALVVSAFSRKKIYFRT
jgi:predicted acyltransferase